MFFRLDIVSKCAKLTANCTYDD